MSVFNSISTIAAAQNISRRTKRPISSNYSTRAYVNEDKVDKTMNKIMQELKNQESSSFNTGSFNFNEISIILEDTKLMGIDNNHDNARLCQNITFKKTNQYYILQDEAHAHKIQVFLVALSTFTVGIVIGIAF